MDFDLVVYMAVLPAGLLMIALSRTRPPGRKERASLALGSAVSCAALLYLLDISLRQGYLSEPIVVLGPPLTLSLPLLLVPARRLPPVARGVGVMGAYIVGAAVAFYSLLHLGYAEI